MTTPAVQEPTKIGLALRVGLFVIIGWLSLVLLPWFMYPIAGPVVTAALSSFGAAAIANAITVRIYERGRLSDLGLGWADGSLRDFGLGAAAGIGAAVTILLPPIVAGSAYFVRMPESERVQHPWASFLFITVVLLFGSAGEEMLFHGYAFQLLIRQLGAFATILPAAVVFGLAHLPNEHVTILAVVNTMAWGILLGYAFVRTNALWMPIGLHFGWNFALPLFGVNLSGFTMVVTGFTLHWRVGDLWSGGAYGPEGSILTTVIVVVLFFVLRRITPEEVM